MYLPIKLINDHNDFEIERKSCENVVQYNHANVRRYSCILGSNSHRESYPSLIKRNNIFYNVNQYLWLLFKREGRKLRHFMDLRK
jgi:hypothetical protein